jgi:hypothetical protein
MSTLAAMVVDQRMPLAPARPQGANDPPCRGSGRLTGGGVLGNERLTAAAGVALLLPLAVIGVTLLSLRTLLDVHLFVGMLLIPPVLLKMASAGYRFVRYYAHSSSYRLKGPPLAALRALAPFVVASTLVVFASGVALLFAGPSSRGTLQPIHKLSFIAWVALVALHLLGHIVELPRMLRADFAPRSAGSAGAAQLSGDVTGRAGRLIALSGALVAGVLLAIVLIPEFTPWLHWNTLHHHH